MARKHMKNATLSGIRGIIILHRLPPKVKRKFRRNLKC
nr:MAG TPA: hypothetical protein [Caudoviricetes sp.]